MIPVRVKAEGKLPEYRTEGAAGADVSSASISPIVIKPGKAAAIPTGLYPEIPSGYELQVRPRSGLALRSSVTVLNSPGTIDSDYRGEIQIILINHGDKDFTVSYGDRIAQLVLSPAIKAEFVPVSSISETERGDSGFGSTGV